MIKTHPCLDCGGPCGYRASRCRSCASRLSHPKKHQPQNCIDCGKLVDWRSKRCRPCYNKWLAKKQRQVGIHSSNWKGGRRKIRGYIYIHAPEHPRHNSSNLIAEHILIWEEANGRPLPKGWVVHHINGIKDDNRSENLFAMPKKNHTSGMLLKEIQKRLRAIETELKAINSQTTLSL